MMLQSPDVLYHLARKESYLLRVQSWLSKSSETLSEQQVGEYESLVASLTEQIRILKGQLRNKGFNESESD